MNSSEDLFKVKNTASSQDALSCSLSALADRKYYKEALAIIDSYESTLTPELLLIKANSYYGLGRYADVLSIISIAEYIDWDTYDIYFLKGKALFALKDYEAANEAFKKSHKMHPTNASHEAVLRCQLKLFREQNPDANVTFIHS